MMARLRVLLALICASLGASAAPALDADGGREALKNVKQGKITDKQFEQSAKQALEERQISAQHYRDLAEDATTSAGESSGKGRKLALVTLLDKVLPIDAAWVGSVCAIAVWLNVVWLIPVCSGPMMTEVGGFFELEFS